MTRTAARPRTDESAAELGQRLRLVVGRLSRALRQHSDASLTVSQLSALSSLDAAGSSRVGDLAARESVGPPAMTRIVTALCDAGLVDRRPDPDDARSVLLEPSAAGRRHLASLRAARTAVLAQRVAALDPVDRRALARALPVLEELLEERDPGHVR